MGLYKTAVLNVGNKVTTENIDKLNNFAHNFEGKLTPIQIFFQSNSPFIAQCFAEKAILLDKDLMDTLLIMLESAGDECSEGDLQEVINENVRSAFEDNLKREKEQLENVLSSFSSNHNIVLEDTQKNQFLKVSEAFLCLREPLSQQDVFLQDLLKSENFALDLDNNDKNIETVYTKFCDYQKKKTEKNLDDFEDAYKKKGLMDLVKENNGALSQDDSTKAFKMFLTSSDLFELTKGLSSDNVAFDILDALSGPKELSELKVDNVLALITAFLQEKDRKKIAIPAELKEHWYLFYIEKIEGSEEGSQKFKITILDSQNKRATSLNLLDEIIKKIDANLKDNKIRENIESIEFIKLDSQAFDYTCGDFVLSSLHQEARKHLGKESNPEFLLEKDEIFSNEEKEKIDIKLLNGFKTFNEKEQDDASASSEEIIIETLLKYHQATYKAAYLEDKFKKLEGFLEDFGLKEEKGLDNALKIVDKEKFKKIPNLSPIDFKSDVDTIEKNNKILNEFAQDRGVSFHLFNEQNFYDFALREGVEIKGADKYLHLESGMQSLKEILDVDCEGKTLKQISLLIDMKNSAMKDSEEDSLFKTKREIEEAIHAQSLLKKKREKEEETRRQSIVSLAEKISKNQIVQSQKNQQEINKKQRKSAILKNASVAYAVIEQGTNELNGLPDESQSINRIKQEIDTVEDLNVNDQNDEHLSAVPETTEIAKHNSNEQLDPLDLHQTTETLRADQMRDTEKATDSESIESSDHADELEKSINGSSSPQNGLGPIDGAPFIEVQASRDGKQVSPILEEGQTVKNPQETIYAQEEHDPVRTGNDVQERIQGGDLNVENKTAELEESSELIEENLLSLRALNNSHDLKGSITPEENETFRVFWEVTNGQEDALYQTNGDGIRPAAPEIETHECQRSDDSSLDFEVDIIKALSRTPFTGLNTSGEKAGEPIKENRLLVTGLNNSLEVKDEKGFSFVAPKTEPFGGVQTPNTVNTQPDVEESPHLNPVNESEKLIPSSSSLKGIEGRVDNASFVQEDPGIEEAHASADKESFSTAPEGAPVRKVEPDGAVLLLVKEAAMLDVCPNAGYKSEKESIYNNEIQSEKAPEVDEEFFPYSEKCPDENTAYLDSVKSFRKKEEEDCVSTLKESNPVQKNHQLADESHRRSIHNDDGADKPTMADLEKNYRQTVSAIENDTTTFSDAAIVRKLEESLKKQKEAPGERPAILSEEETTQKVEKLLESYKEYQTASESLGREVTPSSSSGGRSKDLSTERRRTREKKECDLTAKLGDAVHCFFKKNQTDKKEIKLSTDKMMMLAADEILATFLQKEEINKAKKKYSPK